MNKPTCAEVLNESEDLELVEDTIVEEWRWGNLYSQVFKRISDNTYWNVCFRTSLDGETNDLRDDYASINQVEPYQVTVTKYRDIKRV